MQTSRLHTSESIQNKSNHHYGVVLCPASQKDESLQFQDQFLSDEETFQFQNLYVPARKMSYFRGRFVAKEAVSLCFPEMNRNQIKILNSNLPLNRGQPCVYLPGESDPVGHISISHSSDFAAACFHPTQPVGIDLEIAEKRDDSFLELNFTESEKFLVESLPQIFQSDCATLLWTAKEAMSKVLGKGLSLPTLSMESELDFSQVFKFLKNKLTSLQFSGRVMVHHDPILFSLTSRLFKGASQNKSFLTLATYQRI